MTKRSLSLFSLLLAILPITSAISLADFKPEATRLTPACTTLYNAPISGCTISDFVNGLPCSKTCIQGMFSLNTAVYRACSDNPVNDQFIIGAFLSGKGITTLCPNVADYDVPNPSLAPTSSTPIQTPSPLPSSTPIASSSFIMTPSSSSGPQSTSTSHLPSTSEASSVLLAPPVAVTPTSLSTSSTSRGPRTTTESDSPKTTPTYTALSSSQQTLSREHCGSPFDWCPSDGSTSQASNAQASLIIAISSAFVTMLFAAGSIVLA